MIPSIPCQPFLSLRYPTYKPYKKRWKHKIFFCSQLSYSTFPLFIMNTVRSKRKIIFPLLFGIKGPIFYLTRIKSLRIELEFGYMCGKSGDLFNLRSRQVKVCCLPHMFTFILFPFDCFSCTCSPDIWLLSVLYNNDTRKVKMLNLN